MHDMRFFERNMMGARSQPQSPWILFFDGAIRESGNSRPAGIGAVLKNSRGHTVVELKKLVSPGVSPGGAKYKALIAGLKKALSLGVEFLLVKGDSRLVHSQVVGHCSVQDDQLVEYQRKVLALSKDFRALFMERISRDDNMRADQLANDAIDEELQVVDSLSEFIDQEWTSHEKHASQQHSVHPHTPRQHLRPHAHPLPLPAPHLKVKPVASVSPHVVKRHILREGSESSTLPVDSNHTCPVRSHSQASQHVQAVAKSSRRKPTTATARHRFFSASPPRRPVISTSLLEHMDFSPFSDESNTAASQHEASSSLPPVEGNSASGSGAGSVVREHGDYSPGGDSARVDDENSVSGSDAESSSCESKLDEENYMRLVKNLLKGFLRRKKTF